jgi:probable HAF family extracellular repeat protein
MSKSRIASFAIVSITTLFAYFPIRAVEYSVTDLGVLGGSRSDPYAINSHGAVVGRATVDDSWCGDHSNEHAFIHSGGKMIDLGAGNASCAYGINDAGDVVGASAGGGAFLYSNGNTEFLNLGAFSSANAINNHGQIAGQLVDPTTHKLLACLYDHGTVTTFNPDSGESFPLGINDAGQVLVRTDEIEPTWVQFPARSYIYQNGIKTDLGTLGGKITAASAINSQGDVVGVSTDNNEVRHFFIYKNGAMAQLDLSSDVINILGINSCDQMVGRLFSGSSFLYSNGILADLNSLIPQDCGISVGYAFAINDAGQIATSGTINGECHALLLTPVPEPSAIVLLGIGALGLLAYTRRRRNRGA